MVPVARVAYGFGGGGGSGKLPEGEGGGAGVGVVALPVGVVDISDEGTRYISFSPNKKLLGAFAVGALAGMFLLRRKKVVFFSNEKAARVSGLVIVPFNGYCSSVGGSSAFSAGG